VYCEGESAFFVYGFAKSDRNNIRKDEAVQFKKMARYLLELSDQQLDGLIAMGKLEEIKLIRLRENLSQPVFSRYLNVSKNLVSDWERGVKKPGGPALRLLTVIEKKGLQAIA
jgi:DNA-binding transcriptional regulator YiaG